MLFFDYDLFYVWLWFHKVWTTKRQHRMLAVALWLPCRSAWWSWVIDIPVSSYGAAAMFIRYIRSFLTLSLLWEFHVACCCQAPRYLTSSAQVSLVLRRLGVFRSTFSLFSVKSTISVLFGLIDRSYSLQQVPIIRERFTSYRKARSCVKVSKHYWGG